MIPVIELNQNFDNWRKKENNLTAMSRTLDHKTVQNRGDCHLTQKFRDVTFIRIEEKNF